MSTDQSEPAPRRTRPIRQCEPGLRAALDAAESMRGLAEFCGVSLNAVAHWKRVPLQHVLPIEDRYKISRHTLRPDIYGRKPAAPLPGERGYKPRA